MKFRVSGVLSYEVKSASTFILNINALRNPAQAVLEESFKTEPYFKSEELNPPENQNRYVRLEVPEPGAVTFTYNALVDTSCKLTEASQLSYVPVMQLETSVIPYLYPSRYCQSDKLFRFARSRFGNIENAFEKVLAVTDWIHDNVEYLSGSSDSQTSACDTVTEQAGVCRDFAHLGIALCRALDIPARYFTCYAYLLDPPDFHACFEAFIGNTWVLFDATKLAPLNGLVKIASGYDAADASIATIFGDVSYISVSASCEPAEEGFDPVFYSAENPVGLTYL